LRPDAISDSVLNAVKSTGILVLRIAEQDLTNTSQLLVQFELNSVNSTGQKVGLDWDPSYLMVTRGDNWSDAITSDPLARVGSSLSPSEPTLHAWTSSSARNDN
jgi:hypothetical protein